MKGRRVKLTVSVLLSTILSVCSRVDFMNSLPLNVETVGAVLGLNSHLGCLFSQVEETDCCNIFRPAVAAALHRHSYQSRSSEGVLRSVGTDS